MKIKNYKGYLQALSESPTELFWYVPDDVIIVDTFKFDLYFSPDNEYDRKINHVLKNGEEYDGIMLLSKHSPISEREFIHRFLIHKKEWDIVASNPKPYDVFVIDTYEEYLYALENSTTEMFWATSKHIQAIDTFKFDLYFSHHNRYDRNQNHAFIHIEDNTETYDGIFLLSKNVPLTKKEIEYRFPVNRKEWDIVASTPKLYDRFVIDTYDDYINAFRSTSTELFWVIPAEVEIADDFKFDLYYTKKSQKYEYERSINHVFKNLFNNEEVYTGSVMLMTSTIPVTQREIDFRFLLNKIEHVETASKTKNYDIMFISYNEPNADENYEKLKERFPNVNRVHGIKGIHQAHIEAAKLSTTHMFWVVDGDAVVADDFNFNYLVTRYERDIVHTWQSKNPINNLVYGYGGIKLLPKDLTLSMDVTSSDMTTAISKRFKAMPTISNITAFNTDPFNTWKSAFRECVKLASKTIQGQINAETEERLDTWCNVANGNFAIYALRGAREGRMYGKENAGNLPALSKINDFEWLEQQFKQTSVLR